MPEHTSWFTYLMTLGPFHNLERSLDNRGVVYPAGTPVTLEFTTLAVFTILVILLVSLMLRARIARVEAAIVPEGRLTVTSFMENLVGFFYGMLKDALGEKDAKFFLPLIGTCAVFIFFSNALSLLPGFSSPTANLNVTLAGGLIIMVAQQYYGFKRNGLAYLKHFIGPVPLLAPLMLVLEIAANFVVRPLTLGFRLMANMYVDHMVLGVFTSLTYLVVPSLMMLLGVLVVAIQTYVFCLLSTVYIKMAIEHHDDHEDHGAEGHDAQHGHENHGTGPTQEAPIA
jgi:F-type H+-transporting ATPase subunit a